MDTQLTNTEKNNLCAYVHDIAELETRAYTLKKTIDKFKTHIDAEAWRIRKEEKIKLDAAEIQYNRDKENFENASENLVQMRRDLKRYKINNEPTQKKSISLKDIILLSADALIFLFLLSTTSFDGAYFIALYPIIIFAIVYPFYLWKTARKNTQEYNNEYHTYISKINKMKADIIQEEKREEKSSKELQISQTEYSNIAHNFEAVIKSRCDEALSVCKIQMKKTQQDLNQLNSIIQNVYAFDLIPPDYRELDCVLTFDQIFRNDLADNMREAVKIYEERVFRGEVIRGIDRIYSMLGSISGSMAYMSKTLKAVSDNVSVMSQDIFKASEHMKNMEEQAQRMEDHQRRTAEEYMNAIRNNKQTQEELLRETRLNRYAAEALKESNEKLAWYEDQRHLGYL